MSNIQRQFINIAGTIFDWRETVVTNVEQMAAMAAKSLGYGVRVHGDLRAVVILENTEWSAQHTWGEEISVAHRKIVAKYKYNHVHDAESIREILMILATADAARDRSKSKAPGELADMVSQGINRLQQMVQQQPAPPLYQSESDEESVHAATTSDSNGPAPRRGRRKQTKKKGDTVAGLPPCPHPDHRTLP